MPPSCRQPMNVDVLRWPCGTLATRRSPRGAQPCSQTMSVLTEVSSRKNSLPGVRLGCCSFHCARAAATSGQAQRRTLRVSASSAACSVFFVRQPEPGERAVHQAVAGRNIVHLAEPAAQLGQGGVRTRRHFGPDRVVKPEQLRWHMTPLRACRRFACVPPPAERLRHVGHADTQRVGDLTHSVPSITQCKHPLTQTLGIRLATLPLHPAPPAKTKRELSNRNSTPSASASSIPVSLRTP